MLRQKIAVITPGSFVIPSGFSSSVERVIEKMVPLASGHADIRIYGVKAQGMPSIGIVGGVRCYRLPSGNKYVGAIMRELIKWRPDAIDVHNRPHLAKQLRTYFPRTRVLLSLHSTTFISPTIKTAANMMQALRSVDTIIVNSQFLQEELSRRFPSLEVPIIVNPLGASLDDFVPRWTPYGEALRQARLTDLGWNGRKMVLFIGRLLPSKGVHLLLEAFPTVLQRENDAMLLIVGSAFYGKDRETRYVHMLKRLAEPYKERITFIPYIPYPRIADWYNLADVVVVPSGEQEAFGLVNVEAMASAVPVVASRAGGIPEVVEDERTGYLIPMESLGEQLADRVIEVLGNEEKKRGMGKAGRELVRTAFRWEHTGARWLSIMMN